MPRITDARREMRRREYLEAAWRCFTRTSVADTTMADIAREAGLATGSAYVHFPDKEHLVRAAITISLRDSGPLIADLATTPAAASPSAYVEALLTSLEQFATRLPGVDLLPIAVQGWAVAMSDPVAREAITESYAAIRAHWVQLATNWVGETRADAMAELLASVTLGYIAQRTLLGDASPRAHAVATSALGTY